MVTATGTFERWPVRTWIDRVGIEFLPAPEKGKFTVRVQPDAPFGLYWVRFHDEQGAASPRPFVIGSLPEVLEVEPNDDRDKPQELDSSLVTVNGQLARSGDVDVFALPLRAGQTLVASLEANRSLGSAMDASLQIVSPDGFVRARNDDYHDLDPQIVWTAPSDGKYLVRAFGFPATPDSAIRFAGGSDFVYRLTLTTGAYVEYAYPLAVTRPPTVTAATPARVALCGWNIRDADRTRDIECPASGDTLLISDARWASTARLAIVSHESIVEREPNDLGHPQPVTLPATISGRIDGRGDSDAFGFAAQKGDRLRFRVESRALGFPLDPVLRLTDPGGRILAEVDDSDRSARDPELSYTVPADGELRLQVRDLHGHGGDRYVYRLTAGQPVAGFAARLAADSFAGTPGKPLEIPVTIERANELADEIEVTATDLPPGVTATSVRSSPRDGTGKSVKLTLAMSGTAASGSFRVLATPRGSTPRARAATAPIAGFDHRTEQFWLTIARQR